ncbi:hypothetical protein NC653_029683 [Populus alba x Populus x berolinensis]|uniref:Uncharacterized protein n=1 Tax=Populus alba x Populus x berolinensis TaxID=444605 RepID=A0AAD6M2S3_9ROSI|nr:hypothetical protein NC653_029683 [Populus alba x Populus x berolinensis]
MEAGSYLILLVDGVLLSELLETVDDISLFHPCEVLGPGGRPNKRLQATVGKIEEEKKISSSREPLGPVVLLHSGASLFCFVQQG